MRPSYLTLLLVSLSQALGCKSLVMDSSLAAVDAGDYTLAVAACEGMPGRGADICRFKRGSEIASSWQVVLPEGDRILGGEVEVTFRDVTRTYPVLGSLVSIPFKDILGTTHWEASHDGFALALATIRYQGRETEEVVRARGIAFIVVTDPGYDPLPIDSDTGVFKTKCEIQMSTAGRSALKCSK